MPSKKRVTPISLQPLDALFGTNEETTNEISEIAIGSLHPFPNHPFQVKDATFAAFGNGQLCDAGQFSVPLFHHGKYPSWQPGGIG